MVAESVMLAIRNTFKTRPWVLFQNLSVVIVENPKDDKSVEEQAKDIITRDGPVIPGTPLGDFNVMEASGSVGWIVTSHSDILYTYVPPDKFPEQVDDMMIGLYGRGERAKDSQEKIVVHVEYDEAQK